MTMRVNIENCARNSGPDHYGWQFRELVKHLKVLREGLKEGDQSVGAQFFNLYRFDDNERGEDWRGGPEK